jgi:DNA-directed RNA polymerase subunit RPC12/RpoP
MSGESLTDDKQSSYVCGKCRQEIFYLTSDGPPGVCSECGYAHKDRRMSDVPPQVKLDLTQY